MLDAILDRADELCRLLSAEAGKTLQNAMMGEIFPVCEKLRYTLNHGEDDLRAEKISSGLLLAGPRGWTCEKVVISCTKS